MFDIQRWDGSALPALELILTIIYQMCDYASNQKFLPLPFEAAEGGLVQLRARTATSKREPLTHVVPP